MRTQRQEERLVTTTTTVAMTIYTCDAPSCSSEIGEDERHDAGWFMLAEAPEFDKWGAGMVTAARDFCSKQCLIRALGGDDD